MDTILATDPAVPTDRVAARGFLALMTLVAWAPVVWGFAAGS